MNTHLCSLGMGIVLQAFFLSRAWSYEVIEVKDGGAISGAVKFVGETPPLQKTGVTKDVDVCGKTEKFDEALIVGSDRGIQNVVVSIINIQKGKAKTVAGVLDQKECIYTPRVVLTPAGEELSILNSDGILHNIHTYSTANPTINKAQPKFRKRLKQAFEHPETIKVTCDAHNWMIGWLVVTDHPYYALTDASGAFTLSDVPAGDYELKFWHETLGEMTQQVSVQPNKETTVLVEMTKN